MRNISASPTLENLVDRSQVILFNRRRSKKTVDKATHVLVEPLHARALRAKKVALAL